MILTQCNALISIVDETYWTRSWCSVEALMIQILCRNYLYHEWFVLSPSSIESAKAGAAEAESKSMNNGKEQSQPDAGWKLGRGPLDLEIDPRTKHMAWEEDRDITMFLERQARLLVTPHE